MCSCRDGVSGGWADHRGGRVGDHATQLEVLQDLHVPGRRQTRDGDPSRLYPSLQSLIRNARRKNLTTVRTV